MVCRAAFGYGGAMLRTESLLRLMDQVSVLQNCPMLSKPGEAEKALDRLQDWAIVVEKRLAELESK